MDGMDGMDPFLVLRGIIAAASERTSFGIGRVDFPVPVSLLVAAADAIAVARDERDAARKIVADILSEGTIPTDDRRIAAIASEGTQAPSLPDGG
jgi:hypothetical protein